MKQGISSRIHTGITLSLILLSFSSSRVYAAPKGQGEIEVKEAEDAAKTACSKIEDAQNEIGSDLSQDLHCYLDEPKQPKNHYSHLLKACEVELCGPFSPENNQWHKMEQTGLAKPRENPTFSEKQISNEYKTNIRPRLVRILEYLESDNNKALAALEKRLAELTPESVMKDNTLLNFEFLERNNSRLVFLPLDKNRTLQCNYAAIERRLSDWPIEKQQRFLSLVREYYESDGMKEYYRNSLYTAEETLKLKHPALSLTEARRLDAQKVINDLHQVQNSPFSSTLLPFDFHIPTLEKAARGEELTEAEGISYIIIREKAARGVALLSTLPHLKTFQQPAVESANDILSNPVILARIQRTKARLEDKNKLQRSQNLDLAICRSGYVGGLKESPTANMKKHWTQIEAEARQQLETLVIPQFSESTQKLLRTTLLNVKTELPPDKDQFRVTYDKRLEQLESLISPKGIHPYSLENSIKKASRSELVQMLGLFEFDNSFLMGFCNQFGNFGLSDGGDVIHDKILVSTISINNTQIGKATFLHELGHILSGTLKQSGASIESQAKFQAAQDCLDQKHSKEADFTPGKYVEEDWADLVLSHASIPTDRNVGCFMIVPEGLSSVENTHFDTRNIEDPHSAELFRLLHIHHVRNGALPRVCNKALKAMGVSYDFSNCLK